MRNFTIENTGSTSPSNVRYRIYLSSNNIISSGDYLVGTLSWSTLNTWWDSTGWNLRAPNNIPSGTYYVGALVQYNTNTTDSISYNNSWVLDASRRVTVR